MGSSQIAITNLSFRTSIDDLYTLFSKFGEMIECRMVLNERNESKGYAFVAFKRLGDAREAISDMNGFHVDGRELRVGWATTSRGGDGSDGGHRISPTRGGLDHKASGRIRF
jgi:RNA recognition motif-containing protein